MSTRLSIQEVVAEGICQTIQRNGWDLIHHPRTDEDVWRCLLPGRALTLRCASCVSGLQFLRHGWSGAVRIRVGDFEDEHDLYNPDLEDSVWISLPESKSDFELTIESLAVEGRLEAWLLGFAINGAPKSVSRSRLLNATTKIIYGDWGDFLVLAHDKVIPRAIAKEGSWAPKDIEIFRQHVQPGSAVIDVGANFGHHTIVFSRLVGANGKVLAIEAQRVMWQLVIANAAINACDNIIALHTAAGREAGTVNLFPVSYDGDFNFGSLGIDVRNDASSTEGEAVTVDTLDRISEKTLGDRRIDFVKIDVQAYELFVLQGLERIISEHRPTIFVEISPFWMMKAGYSYTAIYDFLSRHGYEFKHQDWIETDGRGVPSVALDQDMEWDLLAIHPSQASAAQS